MRRLFVPDSAFFIESVRGHFPLTEGSRFWQGVADLATHGRLHVIDQVKKEIDREGDELKLWVNEHLAPALVSTNDAGTAQALSDVMRWVYAQRGLHPVAVDLF